MTAADRDPGFTSRPPSRASGLLFGIGLGGFVDGIVLHQLLQWHHMVTDVDDYPATTVAGLETNIVFDGFFHVLTWVCVLAGSITLLRAWRDGRLAPTWSFHFGLVLLGIHHVRDDLGAPLSWDIGFLVFGALLIAVGWALHRRGLRALQSGTDVPVRH
jgi:uncharacterized membrane protein